MLKELVQDIYETASMDWASAEKVTYTMLLFLERKLPPDDYAHIQKYIFGYQDYVMPSTSGYVGYAEEPPDQAETGRRLGSPVPTR